MRVLITGSSGFIGQHLFEELLQAGYDVWGADVVPPTSPCHLERFHKCDLLDRDQVKDTMGKMVPDAVVHLAARTDLDGIDLDAYSVNTLGSRHLIEAMAETGSVRRGIFTSTQLVHSLGHMPSGNEEYAQTTVYGQSKAAMERLIREKQGGVPEWCIVRPTTVWGPGTQGHLVRFFHMIQRGAYFHTGRKPLRKSYGYVGNIAYQYRKFLEAPAARIHERIFYVADYEPLSLQGWADGLQEAFGARRIPTYPPTLVRFAARLGDTIRYLGFQHFPLGSFRLNNILTEYVYDLTTTREICGELPYTMEQGIRETVRWVKSLEGSDDSPPDSDEDRTQCTERK